MHICLYWKQNKFKARLWVFIIQRLSNNYYYTLTSNLGYKININV